MLALELYGVSVVLSLLLFSFLVFVLNGWLLRLTEHLYFSVFWPLLVVWGLVIVYLLSRDTMRYKRIVRRHASPKDN